MNGGSGITAFLCHSARNAPLATRLAGDLQAQGVRVWYAPWEIRPGDSLRRRIDEGIDEATHFLVLLTPESITSEWVHTELDAGLVQRIAGRCRLIPIVVGVADAAVPATLRGILWVRLDSYDVGLRMLVDACYGVSSKPPVGAPPKRVQDQPLRNLGLSRDAQRLATLLNERSTDGFYEPAMQPTEIAVALDISEEQVGVAADELEERGWIRVLRSLGGSPAEFDELLPQAPLFFETDPMLRGWRPDEDAIVLARAFMLSSG